MTTRMVHPLHGATHAYDNGEIERLKGFGWAVEVPPSNHIPVEDMRVIHEGIPLDVFVQPSPAVARKKPGPKPKAK